MTDMLKIARDLAALRELKDCITHPLVAPLANAAFDHQLRECRDLAEAAGWAEEFERALNTKPIMH
jgi:hypothetical protein